jgi:serine/threonine protein kinase
MSVDVGTRLGSLDITALLGKGGMGEVYRARDAKLKRDVAIKILPEEFSRDHDRVSRFQREAEVLASVNHPNIGTIYDLQEVGGVQFLVLELVEGETLADRITRGPIPMEEALNIAKSICDALEAAHERGVIHRDLKPANVKVTPEGNVKVLDFRLAKAMDNLPGSATLSNSPTMLSGTAGGIILGTAAYMSPEQARASAVDKRADIWAFGAVLYEMLTGKPAFRGETTSDILAAVLKEEPDWSVLPHDVPASVHKLVRRCLTKDRRQRLRDIGEARIVLEGAGGTDVAPRADGQRYPSMPWVIVSILAVALVALLLVHYREPLPTAPQAIQFNIDAPPKTSIRSFAISPNAATSP